MNKFIQISIFQKTKRLETILNRVMTAKFYAIVRKKLFQKTTNSTLTIITQIQCCQIMLPVSNSLARLLHTHRHSDYIGNSGYFIIKIKCFLLDSSYVTD